jgi:hypothetical protein
MNGNQEATLNLLSKTNRITPDMIMSHLKVTPDEAIDLCNFGYMWQARNAFLLRNMGISLDEYEGICNG